METAPQMVRSTYGLQVLVLLLALPLSIRAGDEVPNPGEPGEPQEGTIVLDAGHVWSFFRGTQDPPEGWNQPSFDDTSWERGPTGIGYGDEDDATVLEDMGCAVPDGTPEGERDCTGGGYLAFFARASFEAPEIPEGQRLVLRVSYDDGLVIHVNGVQIGRVNMPDGPVTRNTAALRAVGDAPAEPDAVIPVPAEVLVAGTNLIAVSVHNVNLTSSDASFIPRLIVGDVRDPDPEPDCKEACTRHAAEIAAGCIAEGIPEEECAARKERAFAECVARECDTDPGEPTCRGRCEEEAAGLLERCIAEGGTEDQCKGRQREALAACVARCDGEEPPKPDCEEACAEAAEKVLGRCIEEGGSLDQCRDRAEAARRECVENCGEEPPEKPCADECAASGHAVFEACLDAGGDREECRKHADAIVSVCLERCGAGTPCEDRCAVAAQIVLTGCDLAGLPEGDCRSMANSVLERCVGLCEPPVPCPDRCEDLADRAVAECTARGGSEEECSAAGAAVLEECTSHCDGEPVPDCNSQCEGKAERMLAECIAQGGPERECIAERDAFLARCKEELADVCENEVAALESAFQLFWRGDSNRDEKIDLADAVNILGSLFLGDALPPCEDAADANDDGKIDITDPIYILGSLFLGTGPMPDPSAAKGQDPTADGLLCED